ncbi:unnamed protein product [Caenorhabditis bovis]|uniref:S1 motif domain-containing protein n=1 Tax=Caenorhabditis bovis TaxID=2654633 RepID=A0A8S1F9R0_9PELO|nr:unnamed protein product [Caenorhabditis bovis]
MANKKAIKEEWVLNKNVEDFILDEVEVPVDRAKRICKLFDEGCEVAYVARYRGDVHGGLECEQVRHAFEAYKHAQELNRKVAKAMVNVSAKIEDSKEKSAVSEMIKSCSDAAEVVEITKLYSAGTRKTKASIARGLGFEELARQILDGKFVKFGDSDDSKEHLKISLADLMNKMEKTLKIVNDVSKQLISSVSTTVVSGLTPKIKKMQEDKDVQKSMSHFKEYLNFRKAANKIQNYQVLALERAEENEIINWKIEVNASCLTNLHPAKSIKIHPKMTKMFNEAIEYSITKLMVPKIQRATKRFLTEKAHQAAIRCFSKNLEQLFSREGLRGLTIVALDPGFETCKAAYLDPSGDVLSTSKFAYIKKEFEKKGVETLKCWVKQSKTQLVVFAIGDGKGSYETQSIVANMIQRRVFDNSKNVSFCVVSEVGASKYSITDLAIAELPDIEVTQRSAVSIGRRLIDPMAEYVKIEPRHLGMGMYQHSINSNKLSEALALVVRERVSMRGVDVNCASEHLLRQVCGLNAKSAAGIVAFRRMNGAIVSRQDLKKVAGIGKVSFTQCAGFLTISNKNSNDDEPAKKKRKIEESKVNPLDSTIVHPDQYEIAERILKRIGMNVVNLQANRDELNEKIRKIDNWSDEEQRVVELLLTEAHTIPPPPLLKTVRQLTSLRAGEIVMGTVQNRTDFGIFVNIGVKRDGLVHSTSLRAPWPEVGTVIMVKIDRVDVQSERISLKPV